MSASSSDNQVRPIISSHRHLLVKHRMDIFTDFFSVEDELWVDSSDWKRIVNLFAVAISYNQPKLCPNASWNPNAITLAPNSIVGVNPNALFVDTNNTIFVASWNNGQILIWRNGSVNPTKTFFANLTSSWSLFVTSDEQIFVDSGETTNRVDRWLSNGTKLTSPMSVNSTPCSGLFIDAMDNLYCSEYSRHQVVRTPLHSPSNGSNIIAGTGSVGSTANTLNQPWGIFVTITLGLYVADCGNDRVQLFRAGQTIAMTVAGNGSSGTITLNCPTGIVLDADGYLFISDTTNHRIVGSGPGGFRCVVGCSGQGSASNQLSSPAMIGFDRDGNIFVMDRGNNRLQKFLLFSNSCGQWSREWKDSISTSRLSDSMTASSIRSSESRTGQ